MSREDDVKTLSAGLHEFSTGNEWETLGVAAAIAAFVDARMWEVMKPSEVARLEHRPECASWNISHTYGMQMAATPCNCDLYKRMVAPVQPEATAAKTDRHFLWPMGPNFRCGVDEAIAQHSYHTEWKYVTCQGCLKLRCSCREIQAAEPSRHFKGCAQRVEKADAPYRGEIRSVGLAREWLQHHWPMEPPNALVWSLAEVIAAERAWRSAKELEAKAACDPPAAKPPEPSKPAAVGPERWYLRCDSKTYQGEPDGNTVEVVRASAYEKVVGVLRALVDATDGRSAEDVTWCREYKDALALLAEHDAATGKT